MTDDPALPLQATWKPVVGFEGRYAVSSDGDVLSIGRTYPFVRRLNNGVVAEVIRTTRDRLLAASRGSNGYFTVRLNGKTFAVHSLVLTAFVGPRPDGYAACHCDGDRANNRLCNLRWDTYAANYADIVEHGNVRVSRGRDGRWRAAEKAEQQPAFETDPDAWRKELTA